MFWCLKKINNMFISILLIFILVAGIYTFYYFTWGHKIIFFSSQYFDKLGIDSCDVGHFRRGHSCIKALKLGEKCDMELVFCIQHGAFCKKETKICTCKPDLAEIMANV